MRKFTALLITVALAMLFFSGCASRRQLDSMDIRLGNLEKSNARIEAKINQLDSLYRAQEQSQRTFLASLQATISAFQESLGQLDYKLTDLNERIGKIEQMPRLRQTEPATPVGDTVNDTIPKPVTEVDPAVIFNSAYRSLLAGNQQIAVLGFSEYITSFPNTDLTDDAQFWLGECYYQMDPPRYDQAKGEFQKVLSNYPNSDRKASATFKLARCNEELKETDAAIRLYREIIDNYPQSAEANRARVQLEGLGEK
jgi:tol-pal system protein YbgF